MELTEKQAEFVPTFEYTANKEKWEEVIFVPLLLRYGPPPHGIKFYGSKADVFETSYPRMTTMAAKRYVARIKYDIGKAVFSSNIISHYKRNWKEKHALHIKNLYLRWWHEYSNGR